MLVAVQLARYKICLWLEKLDTSHGCGALGSLKLQSCTWNWDWPFGCSLYSRGLCESLSASLMLFSSILVSAVTGKEWLFLEGRTCHILNMRIWAMYMKILHYNEWNTSVIVLYYITMFFSECIIGLSIFIYQRNEWWKGKRNPLR
jgi:hypothetical protein